eukprot:scaffold1_cov375-Pavlova_lutheri.AAC.47
MNKLYVAWLQMHEALEKDEEDKECERRQSASFHSRPLEDEKSGRLHLDPRRRSGTNSDAWRRNGSLSAPTIPDADGVRMARGSESSSRTCSLKRPVAPLYGASRRQNNFEELFGKRRNKETFKGHMRMTKSCFEKLLNLVRNRLQPSRFSRLNYMSPRRIRTLTVLRLAHGYTYHNLGHLFAIGFIRMPSTEADIASCIASFGLRGFPNACLAVDGCHVKVELADEFDSLQDFICCKGFYSLINVAYVVWNGMFRTLLCG